MPDEKAVLGNAIAYCNSKNIALQSQDKLGYGSDGVVWKTSVPSALKALYRHENYEIELECYRRLKAAGIDKINGLNVPVLEGFDDELNVIEITFVQPPYLLDFGKVRLDQSPGDLYDAQKLASAHHEWRYLFGKRWDDVNLVLYQLSHRFGIHYLDPRPGNINFGDDDDDDDWLAEPGINYSEYE